ncbi:hypothetical protein KS03_4820 [Burkholderia glumae LMG 2196 = ATCC 33617]|nr:hypothetical protein KS03_4820 [Burkholderia glumae LMG 2196 = ATCC 33617]
MLLIEPRWVRLQSLLGSLASVELQLALVVWLCTRLRKRTCWNLISMGNPFGHGYGSLSLTKGTMSKWLQSESAIFGKDMACAAQVTTLWLYTRTVVEEGERTTRLQCLGG